MTNNYCALWAAHMRSMVIKTILGLMLVLASGTLTNMAIARPGFAADKATDKAQVIRYPVLGEAYGQTQPNYFLELLTLALGKVEADYVLEPVTQANFRESRSVMSVAKGLYDVHWMNTNPTRETVLRPIRVPLFKGLIGWRLLMVRDEDRDRFANMSTLEPLRKLKTGSRLARQRHSGGKRPDGHSNAALGGHVQDALCWPSRLFPTLCR